MSNNTPPKEIFVNFKKKVFTADERFAKGYYDRPYTKYLSEESVREILEALEDTIVQNNKDARFREERLETMLAEKDKEIEMLKRKAVESYCNGYVDGELN